MEEVEQDPREAGQGQGPGDSRQLFLRIASLNVFHFGPEHCDEFWIDMFFQ